MGPDVGAVETHEDRDVAHDANGTFGAISTKRLPLFEEKELHGAADVEFVQHYPSRLLDRHRIAIPQFTRPAVPAFQMETRAQTVEQHEVIEPPLVLPAEAFVARARIRRCEAHEIARRFKYAGQLVVEDRQESHGLDTAG